MIKKILLLCLILCFVIALLIFAANSEFVYEKSIKNISLKNTQIGKLFSPYNKYKVLKYDEIIDTKNNLVFIESTFSNSDTRKTFDLLVNNQNRRIVQSKKYLEISNGCLNIDRMDDILEKVHKFKLENLKNKRVIIKLFTSPIIMEFTDNTFVYKISENKKYTKYSKPFYKGYITRIVSGNHFYYLCL